MASFILVTAVALRLLTGKMRRNFEPKPSSSSSLLHSHATSFGFKEVREEQKSQMVGHVFDSVALKYDLMNDIMSAGLHRLWKDRLVSKLNPFPGMKHIDMAGGTGDVAFRILDAINRIKSKPMNPTGDNLQEEAQIYVCDINPNMLNVGKKRATERGLGEDKSLLWLEEDAETLRFEDNSMDGYTIAFGIRNVTHMEKALAEAYRVLKPGGRFLCLELNRVEIPVIRELYDLYSFTVVPAVGKLVTGDRDSYQYLIESIRRFPPQETFASMIEEVGFKNVEYENILGGVVAIHSGWKL
ncbi:UbiE/COQ5 methyltransferase [Corchorus olitorius]|uniref:2-methoxy-6-polyprenyl-1,4-benzoquinol methylase, mitochondrial n=1 Tax=Corchorus olitorius TaxID=93759 RepID=A0A1R3G8R0_9ROSI|nr:UbiE/COQ5 methyltransferase [Corchorus olitorius]